MSVALNNHGIFHWFVGFFEHATAVVLGVFLMVVGLGLGVTMVMLPVGLVVGLMGVAVLIGGLFAHIDKRT